MISPSAFGLLAVAWAQVGSLTEADQARVVGLMGRHEPAIRSTFGSIRTDTQSLTLEDGHIVVAVSGGGHPEILLFRIDRRGVEVWDPGTAAVRTAGRMENPRIVLGPDGGIDIAWLGGGTDELFVRRLSKDGATNWTSRIPGVRAFHYDLACMGTGGVLAAWAEPSTVHAALIGDGGAVSWHRRWPTLSSEIASSHNPVSCIAVGELDALLVWYRYAQPGNTFLAQRIRLRDGGVVWATPTTLGDAPSFGLSGPKKVTLWRSPSGSIEALLSRGRSDDVVGERTKVYRVRIGDDGRTTAVE